MTKRKERASGIGWLSFILLFIASFANGQASGQGVDIIRAELYSPWVSKGDKTVSHDRMLAARSCFSLIEYRWSCSKGMNISYGNRIGDNWDILALHGTQSRMIDLGPAEWSDKIETPYIVPFSLLGPGEKRHFAVHVWGADGVDGRDADGTSSNRKKRESNANKPVAEQVSSKTESRSGELFVDNYNPLLETRKGHMYAIRLVEGKIDQYYLMRVDDVVRGQKISISLRKADPPSKRPIF